MKFTEKFLPNQSILQNMTYRDQKKVNVLLTGDVICFVMFFLFSIALIAIGKNTTGIAMVCLCVVFFLSMLLIKKGKLVFGSYITTLGLCIASIIVAFLTSRQENPLVNYRTICFCVAIACLNYMISLKRGQLILYMSVTVALLFGSTFILYYPDPFITDIKEWISSVVINMLAVLCANSLLIASSRSNDQIVEHSEKEHEQVSETLVTITNVLNQVKESLNVGQKLNNAADNASNSVSAIQDVYQTLISATEQLGNQAYAVKVASEVVNERSNVMSNSLLEQNNSITEISSAITEISANISQIDGIAEKRKEGMLIVNNALENQNVLIQRIVDDVNKVKDSSIKIADFVKTVNKIAQQTNLLAMNASIEAAHSGENGKGFGVIAQEIRKLSEETTINAKKIYDTLEQNSIVVQETTESVNLFADATQKSEQEIKQTFNSMEEILHGIGEIDIGTRDIMNSVNKVADVSQNNAVIIDEVVNQISNQNLGIEKITSAAASLKDRVNSINEMLPQISNAMVEIHNSAIENEEVSTRIAEILK